MDVVVFGLSGSVFGCEQWLGVSCLVFGGGRFCHHGDGAAVLVVVDSMWFRFEYD
ncbi:hypothetical protein L195_g033772 [Trifolium pratense]|uniref:Uncharacterized protein n=1 Tax=Trifolium pratense TaxID=57577 RepID=A0A2K3LGY9_TRIPR|nr:hypothetical protein L195_g033772 [Trifolium pratense]